MIVAHDRRLSTGPIAGAALALVVACFGAWPAAAAVRDCAQMTLGAVVTDSSEVAARRRALADWMRRARAAGVAAPAWRTARDKSVVCRKVAAGTECQARAAPCVIRQQPGGPQPVPLRRARRIEA